MPTATHSSPPGPGAAVVLTAPDDSRTLVRETDTFAARLVHAGEEAILTARVVQVTVDAHGYAFAHQSFGQWQEPGWCVFWRTVGKDLWQEYSSDFPYWDGPA